MPHANFDPKRTRKYANDEERRMNAYKDWMGGMSYRALAKKHGYHDHAAAIRAVDTARKAVQDGVVEAREQATERIMGPLLAMRSLAMEGDAQGASAHKGYEDRLAKLWGLDMPAKSEVDVKGAAAFPIIANPRRLPPKAIEQLAAEQEAREQESQETE